MELKFFDFYAVNGKKVNLLAPQNTVFPSDQLDAYDKCCGPGGGFGEQIIPEKIWGVRISAACYIHDRMYEVALPDIWERVQSDTVFSHNMRAIISALSKTGITKSLRMYRATTYYNAVDYFGEKVFWRIKERQQLA